MLHKTITKISLMESNMVPQRSKAVNSNRVTFLTYAVHFQKHIITENLIGNSNLYATKQRSTFDSD